MGGWLEEGGLTGQVLYDKKEISYAADYASLENETYDMGRAGRLWEPGDEQYLRRVLDAMARGAMPWICILWHQGKREGLVDRFLAELYASEEHSAISGYDGGSEPQKWQLDRWSGVHHMQDALQVLPEGEV